MKKLKNFKFNPIAADIRDIGNWWSDLLVPNVHTGAYTTPDIAQPGSRIYLIDPDDGIDSIDYNVASYLYWNGTNLVDTTGSTTNPGNGQLYGTDPLNPNQAAIKPYKSWSFVAPHRNGNGRNASGDLMGVTGDDIGHERFNAGQGRVDKPDWWLIKEALAAPLDLAVDLARAGAGVNSGLSLPGGTGTGSLRQVLGRYGPGTGARPRIIGATRSGGIMRRGYQADVIPRHMFIFGLHIDGHTRTLPDNGYPFLSFTSHPASSIDITFEDVWVDGRNNGISPDTNGRYRFRRCIMGDAFKAEGLGHFQNLYFEGTELAQLIIEDCLLYRGGFNTDPKTQWPPTGTMTFDAFRRNEYLAHHCDHANSHYRRNVSLVGASGTQFRLGMRVRNNFFLQGYVISAAGGGDSQVDSGSFEDNVVQTFYGTGTNSNLGQPPQGCQVAAGAQSFRVTNNIVTDQGLAPATATDHAFSIGPVIPSWNMFDVHPTRGVVISGNLAIRTNATNHYSVDDGIPTNTAGYVDNGNGTASYLIDLGSGTNVPALYTYPGIVNNFINSNVHVGAASVRKVFTARGGTPVGASDPTKYGTDVFYADIATAAAALNWIDGTWNFKKYLQACGFTITSADGVKEYCEDIVPTMKKGTWRIDMTAPRINNSFRYNLNRPWIAEIFE